MSKWNEVKKMIAKEDVMDIGGVFFGFLVGAATIKMAGDKNARDEFVGALSNLKEKTPYFNKLPMGAEVPPMQDIDYMDMVSVEVTDEDSIDEVNKGRIEDLVNQADAEVVEDEAIAEEDGEETAEVAEEATEDVEAVGDDAGTPEPAAPAEPVADEGIDLPKTQDDIAKTLAESEDDAIKKAVQSE